MKFAAGTITAPPWSLSEANSKLKTLCVLSNDPGPNRTADLPLRRRPLYPLSYRTLLLYILTKKYCQETTLPIVTIGSFPDNGDIQLWGNYGQTRLYRKNRRF